MEDIQNYDGEWRYLYQSAYMESLDACEISASSSPSTPRGIFIRKGKKWKLQEFLPGGKMDFSVSSDDY